jgi:uncharacterized damage-inducible protein DinB
VISWTPRNDNKVSISPFPVRRGEDVKVKFDERGDGVLVTVTFDAETENAPELQRAVPHSKERTCVDERELFTKFWVDESSTTRTVLARIPEGSDYRPDPKSRTAQEIAWQIVCEEKMIIDAMETGEVSWAPPPTPRTMREIVAVYEEQSAAMPARWHGLSPEQWNGMLDFFGSQRPASPMAWSFLFDIIHHRGQITTYLRPMGAKVPQIYGPSADEP